LGQGSIGFGIGLDLGFNLKGPVTRLGVGTVCQGRKKPGGIGVGGPKGGSILGGTTQGLGFPERKGLGEFPETPTAGGGTPNWKLSQVPFGL